MSPYIVAICILASALRGAYAANCACATGNVYVRSGGDTSHPTLGTLTSGTCIPYLGDQKSGWVHVQFKGGNGWVSGHYVNIQSCSGGSPGSTGSGGCPRIVTRSQWGASNPKSRPTLLRAAVPNVFIHHGQSPDCHTQVECSHRVKSYQNYHMNTKGWNDIAYSFLIGEDGNAYEGRGWNYVGAHTRGYNSVGLGFCMVGNFMHRTPNAAAINAVRSLIACGVKMGKIQTNYRLRGHRDVGTTECPGTAMYHLIQTWPHYRM